MLFWKNNKASVPVIVLGMHRSGTSCLAGLLEEAGVYLGEVSKKNPFNVKGNHENTQIVNLNDALLKLNSGNWHNPPDSLKWTNEHADERDALLESFKSIDCQYWGFKDPRVVFTLGFWSDGIVPPHFIGTFRHPLSVATSIHARNNKMSIDYGLQVWKKYNQRLLEYYENSEFPLISFDVDSESYLRSVESAFQCIGISGVDTETMEFFDDSLRHNKLNDTAVQLPSDVEELYSKLVSIYNLQNQRC